MNNTVVSILL